MLSGSLGAIVKKVLSHTIVDKPSLDVPEVIRHRFEIPGPDGGHGDVNVVKGIGTSFGFLPTVWATDDVGDGGLLLQDKKIEDGTDTSK